MGHDGVSIAFEKVTKFYPAPEGEQCVLRDLSFSVEPGEFFCIIGPSGCGKTTLLNLLCGFDKPEGGRIMFRGSPVEAPTREIVMVFQDFNQLLPWKTAEGNIALPFLGAERKDAKKKETVSNRVKQLLRQVGLEKFGNRYPHQLSGGMKQRAAIARGLAAEPSVLCMDEPFGSVDAVIRSRLQELILSLWSEKGITVIFVTHDIKEALLLSDRILFIESPGGGTSLWNNTLPRPRDTVSPEFQEMAHTLFDRMEGL